MLLSADSTLKSFEQLNKNGESKDWIREIKPHEDPNVDPWEKEKAEKKERVAKNEHARLKNIGKNSWWKRTFEKYAF